MRYAVLIRLFLFSALAGFLGSCTEKAPEMLSGGGSEAENAFVAGAIVDDRGVASANTLIRLIPVSYNPVSGGSIPDSLLDTTDNNGRYELGSVDTGSYNLEALHLKKGTRLLMADVQVKDKDNITLPEGSLKQPGAILIPLSATEITGDGYAYIPGTTVWTAIGFLEGSPVNIILDSIPEGLYEVRYVPESDPEAEEVLAEEVAVHASDTTVIRHYAGWKHARPIVLNTSPSGADVADNVFDFPVLVRLNSQNFNFSQARNSGADIRFTKSDDTPLPYQIERWNSAGEQAEIWVKLDTVYRNNSIQHFIMFWGNENAEDESDGSAVFPTERGFTGVYHLAEDGSSITDGYRDATANGAHGRGINMDAGSDVDGIIGVAQDFERRNLQYIEISRESLFDFTQTVSVSAWIQVENFSEPWQAIVNKGDGTWRMQRADTSNSIESAVSGTSDYYLRSAVNVNDAAWHHVAIVYDGTRNHIYIDGQLAALSASNGRISTNDDPVWIGNNSDYPTRSWDGIIDEVRISGTARSAAWIKLSYENQKHFQKFAQLEDESPGTWAHTATITLNTTASGANVQNDVYDFPVLVRLTGDNFDFSGAAADGGDLRFAKPGGAPLHHEIERWDPAAGGTGAAEIWVRADTVYGSNGSQHFLMYWGNEQASAQSQGAAVFNTQEHFSAVWHLGDDCSDATLNENNGTNVNSVVTGGVIGKGRSFNGSDSYIIFGNGNSLNQKVAITVEAWICFPEPPESGTTMSVIRHDGHYTALQLFDGPAQSHTALWGKDSSLHFHTFSFDSLFGDNQWHHFVSQYDMNRGIRIFKDGEVYSEDSITVRELVNRYNVDFVLGAKENQTEFFKGLLDEVRVSNTFRDGDWIKLSYENQKPNSVFVKIEKQ